ncbi:hypothetical protein [Microcella alkalica]|uniref:hypothetical protein n=1 Tax=Microcella alkalica TaxID=355930 RepID=UPI00145C7857|nr:hypothetical protein [Microcella alkalica]
MIPEATHVTRQGNDAWITCPYCRRRHLHRGVASGLNWRAPGCGLYRNASDRLDGYTFTTKKGNR